MTQIWTDDPEGLSTNLKTIGEPDLGTAVNPLGTVYARNVVVAGGTSQGTVTLNGATPVSVSNTAVTAASVILLTLKTVGGTVGAVPSIKTITPGVGFTVAGTAGDTSVYNYAIL